MSDGALDAFRLSKEMIRGCFNEAMKVLNERGQETYSRKEVEQILAVMRDMMLDALNGGLGDVEGYYDGVTDE